MPSHVNGFGVSTVLTKTAGILFPQTSVTTGVTGASAATKHSTVEPPFTGTTGELVTSIV